MLRHIQSLVAISILLSAQFSADARLPGLIKLEPTQSIEEDEQLIKLINQLDSDKYKTREAALQKLKTMGLPAAKSLIQTTLDQSRSFEVRNRCFKILTDWSKDNNEKRFAGVAKLLAAIPLEKADGSNELRMLREHYQLDLSSDPQVALERLKAGGIKVIGKLGNPKFQTGTVRIEAFRWGGRKQDLAYLGRINQAASLRTTPDMLSKVIDHLKSSKIDTLFISRAPSETKFRRFPVVPESIDEAVCRKLSQIPTLRRLDFSAVKVPQQGFKHLAKCKGLESLTLTTGTTDEDLEFLASLKNLKELRFHNAFDVKGEGLQHISKLQNLEKLEMFYTSVSGKNLKHLTSLKKLKHLYAPQVRMDDIGMRHIAKISSLEELRLDNTKVTNEGLAAINKMPRLRSISLVSGSFSNSGVLNLLSLPNLSSVSTSAGLITKEIKTQLDSESASFKISGQFFEPNSSDEYKALEILLNRGIQVAQYPRPNNLTLQLFSNSWRGKGFSDLQAISQLNQIQHLRLYIYGDQPEELINEIVKVDSDLEVRLFPGVEDNKVLKAELATKLKTKFPAKRR